MEVVQTSLEDVRPYEGNPRVIPEEAISRVVSSIQQFGWRQPIVVDGDGVIIAGHTRYLAAQEMGLSEVPVVWAKDMTAEQAKAYRLADNKVAEASFWDDDALAREIVDLMDLEDIDLTGVGFSDEAISELAQAAFAPDLQPTAGYSDVSPEDVEKADQQLQTKHEEGAKSNLVDLICPNCGHEYSVDKTALD